MRKPTRIGTELLALAACAALMYFGPHTAGVEMGWVTGAIMAAGALSSAYGAKKASQGYSQSKSVLKDWGRKQRGQIDSLYGQDPYGQVGLGMNPTQMGAKMSEGSAENAAELKGNLSDIETQAAQGGGGLRAGSGAYARNRQRAVGASLGRVADIRRRNLLADAVLRRQDFDRRFDATSGSLYGNASLYNANKRASGDVYSQLGQSAMNYGAGAMEAKAKKEAAAKKEAGE